MERGHSRVSHVDMGTGGGYLSQSVSSVDEVEKATMLSFHSKLEFG